MNLTINLDFIPTNLDGEPILGHTLAKEVGWLLCSSTGTSYSMEKYIAGKQLFDTGSYVFIDTDDINTQAMIEYFKNLCENYPKWDNQIKGMILKQINQII